MQASSPKVDVAFVAAHVLGAAIHSGGDVLFANVAREIALLRPEWNIAAIAPDYACDGLAPFFRTVVPLPSLPDEANRLAGHPRAVVAAWRRRIKPCEEALARLAPSIVHTTGDFFADVFPAARAKRRGDAHWTGVVHHINPPPLRRRNEITAASASWLLQLATLRALRRGCERVLLLNQDVRTRLLGRGFSSTQLAVTGAGIDLQRFALRPPPPPGRRVLWVHRLEPTKGMFDLPRLAALLGDGARIDVVGRGPRAARERLENMIDRARVRERIAFHGHVDDAALAALYANANAFVSCSYEEGWGLSIAEALAAGVPCFAYALPSHREIFGSVVETAPVGNVAALAQRIRGAFARRDRESDRARRRAAVERHSFGVVAERHVTIFEQLLGA